MSPFILFIVQLLYQMCTFIDRLIERKKVVPFYPILIQAHILAESCSHRYPICPLVSISKQDKISRSVESNSITANTWEAWCNHWLTANPTFVSRFFSLAAALMEHYLSLSLSLLLSLSLFLSLSLSPSKQYKTEDGAQPSAQKRSRITTGPRSLLIGRRVRCRAARGRWPSRTSPSTPWRWRSERPWWPRASSGPGAWSSDPPSRRSRWDE